MGDVSSFINDLSPTGFINAGDQIKDRGLSRSIGTHHPQDLSFLNAEGEIVNRCQVPKSLCQILSA